MKINELKIGDTIKIKTNSRNSGQYVKICQINDQNVLVYETHFSGGGQWIVDKDDILAKINEVTIEPEIKITYTEDSLIQLCRAIETLAKEGKQFFVDYGYRNAVDKANLPY